MSYLQQKLENTLLVWYKIVRRAHRMWCDSKATTTVKKPEADGDLRAMTWTCGTRF
jgi:hypothetical protein